MQRQAFLSCLLLLEIRETPPWTHGLVGSFHEFGEHGTFPSKSNDFIPSLGNWVTGNSCSRVSTFREEHLDDESGPLANLNALPPTVGGKQPLETTESILESNLLCALMGEA
jgi:hypothetical protein